MSRRGGSPLDWTRRWRSRPHTQRALSRLSIVEVLVEAQVWGIYLHVISNSVGKSGHALGGYDGFTGRLR
jgi:hypothetical protein